MPRSLSVRARVVSSLAGMLLPMLAIGGISLLALHSTLDRFAETADEARSDTIPIARLQGVVLEAERAGLHALTTGTRADRLRYEQAAADVATGFRLLRRAELSEERVLVDRAKESAERGLLVLDAALADAVLPPDLTGRGVDAARAATDRAVQALQRAEAVSRDDMAREYAAAQRLERATRSATFAVLVAGLLVALAGGLHVVRSLLTPLGRLRDAVRHLGDGTLSHRVRLDRRDEFADLADALNDMAEEVERSHRELAHQALHDGLTGLPNRVLLGDRLDRALAHAHQHDGTSACLLLIDLDGFKGVNDTLGHEVGDDVLRSAAERLRLCLRPTDTAARLGGDEFAVLLDGDASGTAVAVAERVLRAMRPGFHHCDREIFLSASIGVAVADGRTSAADLLRDADLAMYRAKHGGKDRICVYDPSMHEQAEERLRTESDLRRALQHDELVLHYQPVYSLDGGSLVAVEALMRWNHSRRGLVAPGEFIPVAEQSGLIGTIGAWALDEACRQLREWDDELGVEATAGLRMSVNLSARQLTDSALPTVVEQALTRHAVEPRRLMLEITESTMVADVPATVARLTQLKELGVQLAIDDFGTGYSSLAYLQQFPIDQIKIDKAFVDRIDSPEGAALAESIINLARALTLEPIAEGIEHPSQLVALDRLGCRLGQGFHLARPQTGADIGRRIAAARRAPVA